MIIKFLFFIVFTQSHLGLGFGLRCISWFTFFIAVAVTFSLGVKWKIKTATATTAVATKTKQITTFVSLRDFATEIGFGINASHRYILLSIHSTLLLHKHEKYISVYCLLTPPGIWYNAQQNHRQLTDEQRKWMKFSSGKIIKVFLQRRRQSKLDGNRQQMNKLNQNQTNLNNIKTTKIL